MYNSIRETCTANPLPRQEFHTAKRKATAYVTESPAKRPRTAEQQTPQLQGRFTDAAATPSTARKLIDLVVPTSIGPTPQRDGRVLGIFDALLGVEAETPSRARRRGTGEVTTVILATPTKQVALAEPGSAARLGRTPLSSTKRLLLDSFTTPLKKREANIRSAKTPISSSVSKLQFATPAFLRRAILPAVDENGAYVPPPPRNLPRKPVVRGLSSVITSLRKMEDDELDEDLELLREMENEGKPAPLAKLKPTAGPEAQAEDGQVLRPLLGGFDDEGMYDSAPEDQVGRDGQPLRVFKKKGQKRTTKLVRMRPTRATRSKAHANEEEESSASDDDDDVVPETQLNGAQVADAADAGDDARSTSQYGGSGDEAPTRKKAVKKQAKGVPAKEAPTNENKIKKAARKVNELAHANFKRLKLRNTGSKGGPSHNSRFRRRR